MDWQHLLEIFPYVFLSDLLRYLLAAGAGYLIFWVFGKKRWHHRRVQGKAPATARLWLEFRYSMNTVAIFALVGTAILLAERAGYTRIYDEIGERGWGYLLLSIAIMIVAHDAYFYWTHRLLHLPLWFRRVHLVHHRSTNPSPWAAYAFHPVEAVIQAGIFPLIVFILPAHGLALTVFLLYMIVRNVQGHLGIEILPRGFLRARWFRWHTTATHHDLHHRYSRTNYGLYFRWWDRWLRTEDPMYEAMFHEVTQRRPAD